MDGTRIREIAAKLEALDNGLYDDVLELLAESRRLAVEEYKRGLVLVTEHLHVNAEGSARASTGSPEGHPVSGKPKGK
jgi:hypothetical protein